VTNLQVPGLIDPLGLTVDAHGDAFITNHASGALDGQLIKVSGLS
jgi:hypothetical protein